jgi:periplasmic protein TonB
MLLRTSAASYESGLHRAPGAFGASLASHAAIIGLLYLLMSLPGPASTLNPDAPHPLAGLIWIPSAAEGHGGGGGGDHSLTTARRLQTVGMDAVAVPILKPPPLTPPDRLTDDQQQPAPMALILPVRQTDAGTMLQAGVINNASLAPDASQGSGRNGGAGTGTNGGSGDDVGPGEGPGRNGGTGGDVYAVGGNVLAPILLREVKPAYTPEAMRARIQGEVVLVGVVLPDGSVTRLRVLRSLDGTFGLDQEAIKAVRQWKFKPGMRLGQPVATEIAISVGFSMR